MPSWSKRQPTWKTVLSIFWPVPMKRTVCHHLLPGWTGLMATDACWGSPPASWIWVVLISDPKHRKRAGHGTSVTGILSLKTGKEKCKIALLFRSVGWRSGKNLLNTDVGCCGCPYGHSECFGFSRAVRNIQAKACSLFHIWMWSNAPYTLSN